MKLGKLRFGHCLTKMLFTGQVLHRPRHMFVLLKLQLLKFGHTKKAKVQEIKFFSLKLTLFPLLPNSLVWVGQLTTSTRSFNNSISFWLLHLRGKEAIQLTESTGPVKRWLLIVTVRKNWPKSYRVRSFGMIRIRISDPRSLGSW